jgi:hypothetical protein
MIYGLYITYASGYVSLHTYSRAEERGYEMILLSNQPVILRCVEWAA